MRVAALIALAGLALLWAAGDAQATETEVESGAGSQTACEGDVTFFVNVTATNDDSPESDYDITITAAGIGFNPGSAQMQLAYGESDTAFFIGIALKGSSYKQVHATIFVDSSSGEDETDGTTLIIAQCTGVALDTTAARVVDVAGDTFALEFRLTNFGNYIDTFTLELQGLPAGWEAEFLAMVELGMRETLNITVNLTPGPPGEYRLALLATTTLANDTASDRVTVVSLSFFQQHRTPLLLGGSAIVAAGVALYARRS